jgi:phosphoribosylamine---glycine ligase
MKILVVGNGGREHALCHSFNKSTKVSKIYCANGNAGISEIAECININPDEIIKIADFAEDNSIDLTFVGGETSLAAGIVDEFEKRKLKIIGVTQKAAQLESSKSFAKDFMARHKIPTAAYRTAHSAFEAIEMLEDGEFGGTAAPVVVKADGLAAGKGVVVAQNRREAVEAINELEKLVGKSATEKIVLEECLFGREVSLILFADGQNFALMPPTRDHKRIFENDRGANTGGMGTITDANLLSPEQTEKIIAEVIKPTLKGCETEGFPFRGILFLGLMLTASGVKVLEYNVRFGDPETQSILVRLETDLVEICEAIRSQTLDKTQIKWREGNSACVILAAKNYPNKPQKGDKIQGLEAANNSANVTIFHGGTSKNDQGEIVTSGGRILGVTAVANSLDEALILAYETVSKISFDGIQFRRDIGK